MTKLIDLTGQRFGKLVVLERDFSKTNGTYWKCKCDCGTIISTRKDTLTRAKNPKQSCGCDLYEKNSKAHLKNEIGNEYGYLTVISRANNANNGEAVWHCKCKCGKEIDVKGSYLRSGNTKSCGCKKFESHNGINEIGNRYGKLTVISPAESKDGHMFWHCKCDCGNECDVRGSYLRKGITTSCGCVKSKGETRIAELLQENNISYKREYTFTDLSGKNKKLRFDFAVFDNQNNLSHLIEFDGIQHFEQKGFSQNEEDFKLLQEYDSLKNNYCKEHNIKLIRIPYTKLDILKIEDLV